MSLNESTATTIDEPVLDEPTLEEGSTVPSEPDKNPKSEAPNVPSTSIQIDDSAVNAS